MMQQWKAIQSTRGRFVKKATPLPEKKKAVRQSHETRARLTLHLKIPSFKLQIVKRESFVATNAAWKYLNVSLKILVDQQQIVLTSHQRRTVLFACREFIRHFVQNNLL